MAVNQHETGESTTRSGISVQTGRKLAAMDDSPFLDAVSISADQYQNLANGDTVTFTAEVSEDVCDEYRMKPSRTSMTYTVAVDQYYITPSVELSDAVRASLADDACHSMEKVLNSLPYDAFQELNSRYAKKSTYNTDGWSVEEYTIRPLSVIISQPDTYVNTSRICIALEVSAVYNTEAETDPAAPISDTSIWGIVYYDTIADDTGVLSFDDRGAAYIMQDDLDDLRFDIRRLHGAIAEIDLSDMSETTSS